MSFISGHCEFDFVILVDASRSIESGTVPSKRNWPLVITMLRTLTNVINSNSQLGSSSRVGIIRFQGNGALRPVLHEALSLSENADRARVNAAIDSIVNTNVNGRTPMLEALQLAVTGLTRNVRNIGGRITATQGIIVFTDGKPNDGTRDDVRRLLKQQMDKGVHVIMIGEYSKKK